MILSFSLGVGFFFLWIGGFFFFFLVWFFFSFVGWSWGSRFLGVGEFELRKKLGWWFWAWFCDNLYGKGVGWGNAVCFLRIFYLCFRLGFVLIGSVGGNRVSVGIEKREKKRREDKILSYIGEVCERCSKIIAKRWGLGSFSDFFLKFYILSVEVAIFNLLVSCVFGTFGSRDLAVVNLILLLNLKVVFSF